MNKHLLDRFDKPLTAEAEKGFLTTLITQITEDAGLSLLVALCNCYARGVLDGQKDSLTKLLAIDPMSARDEKEFFAVRQIQALFSKRASIIGFEADKRGNALATFWSGEQACRETNKKLRNKDERDYHARANLIFKMSRKISLILGPCPSIDQLDCSFGPGANVGCKKTTNVKSKLASDCTMTEAAGRAFIPYADHYHAWPGLKKPKLVSGSEWTSVPKTFKTDRAINIEPILNAFVQKGIGGYIRERLRKFGINLRDQTVNQRLALQGSREWNSIDSLATIDLSNASDTIAYNLVLDLLPFDWFELLDNFRSPTVEIDRKRYVIEKFSAMGNAYTFELESLIFYALLTVVCDEHSTISVYGDDMICPVRHFDQAVAALQLLGFTPNREKSFSRGPFRESCGKDYWAGTEVRPVFLKGEDLTYRDVFRLHNFFTRSGRLSSVEWMIAYIPSRVRLFGPDGYGDGHLLGDCPTFFDKRTHRMMYKFNTYSAKASTVGGFEEGKYGAFLHANRRCTIDPPSDTIDNCRSFRPQYRRRTLRVPVVT